MDKHIIEALGGYLPYITLLLALIALGLIGVLFNKVKDLLRRLREIQHSKVQQTSNVGRTNDPFDYSRIIALETKFDKLSNNVHELELKAEPPKVVEPIAEKVIDEVPVVVVEKDLKFYSKFPDQDQGFTESSLMTKQNGEQIYELILTPEEGKGIFFLSESSDVQKYALSDVNFYLPKGCQFLNQPGKSVGIKTVEAGTLSKLGEIWLIEDKVQIEFI